MLDAISLYSKDAKCLFANSSEIFDGFSNAPQDESADLQPRNPYGVSKAMSSMAVKSYRDAFHLHLSNSISFNHEVQFVENNTCREGIHWPLPD